MRKIVIGGWVLSALVLAGCSKSSSSGGETPAQSSSANSAVVPTATSTSSASAKTEPGDKDKDKDKDKEKKGDKREGPKEHVARFKALEEAFTAHDPKKFSALFADDAVVKTPGLPDVKGHEDIEKSAEKMFAVFKDAKLVHGRVWEKDKHTVVVESVFTGTNTGDAPEMGIPKATNKAVGVVGASWYEIGDDGLIKEERRYHDQPTVMGQLVPDKKNAVRAVITTPPDGTEHHKAKTEEELKEAKDEKEKVEITKGMEIEKKNVELDDKFAALMSEHKVEDVLKLVTEDVTFVDYTQDKDVKGKKAFKDLIGVYLTAFPDIKAKPTKEFGDGEFVVVEYEYTGTQKGPLGPIKATNKPITLHQLEVDLFKDGKQVKGWAWGNNVELLTEIGVMPPPGAAPAPSGKPNAPPK